MSMSKDVIRMIMLRLDFNSIRQCMRVNKFFYQSSQNHYFLLCLFDRLGLQVTDRMRWSSYPLQLLKDVLINRPKCIRHSLIDIEKSITFGLKRRMSTKFCCYNVSYQPVMKDIDPRCMDILLERAVITNATENYDCNLMYHMDMKKENMDFIKRFKLFVSEHFNKAIEEYPYHKYGDVLLVDHMPETFTKDYKRSIRYYLTNVSLRIDEIRQIGEKIQISYKVTELTVVSKENKRGFY